VRVTTTNASGSVAGQSSPTSTLASASSPFAISSSIQDGATISGSINWQATPSQAVNFVQFYVDGALSQTQASAPYSYNAGTTGTLDTTKLSNGTHVLGFEALSTD